MYRNTPVWYKPIQLSQAQLEQATEYLNATVIASRITPIPIRPTSRSSSTCRRIG